MKNKFLSLHNILRMAGALLAIIIFISMFITKMAVHQDYPNDLFFDFKNGAFFGNYADNLCDGYVFGFFGYLFVLLGGLAGLAFVFLEGRIEKKLLNLLSFVAGGVVAFGAIVVIFFAPAFIGLNDHGVLRNLRNYTTAAGPIVFGILGLGVAAFNILAPILEKKGKQLRQNKAVRNDGFFVPSRNKHSISNVTTSQRVYITLYIM